MFWIRHISLRRLLEAEGNIILAIHIAAMTNRDNFDYLSSIINQIQNAIIAHAQAIALLPAQFLGIVGTRVVCQLQERLHNAILHCCWQFSQLSLCGAFKSNNVTHRVFLGRSARYSDNGRDGSSRR